MTIRLLKAVCCVLIALSVTSCINDVHVQAPAGNFMGEGGGSIDKFLGIPYAQAPVGHLRWKPPVTKAHVGNYDASYKRPNCPQGPGMTGVFITSEDCLFINIYRPKNITTPVPVMVFLHGGAFDIGSGSEIQYDGQRLAERGVMVITVNYRLGILGHLALPELTAEGLANEGVEHSGNYALLDQVKALEWVQTNISSFGGDKNNVTLFGESAGAMSTCYHLGSLLSKDLFHKAILQSGNCEFATRSLAVAETNGLDFATDVMGCPEIGTLNCMRSKSPGQIKAAILAKRPDASALSFDPILPLFAIRDNYFITEPTVRENVIAHSNISTPVIIGINKNEGSMFHSFSVPSVQTNDQYYAKLDEYYDEPALTDAKALYPAENYAKAINALADIDGDKVLTCPARWTADMLADKGHSVYFFELGQATATGMPVVVNLFTGGKGPDLGVFHSHDIAFVFGMPSVIGDAWHASGRHTMYMTQEFWTNFAKNGTPTSDFAGRLGGPTTWPTYDSTTRTYYSLKEGAATGTQLKQAKCDFMQANLDPYFHDPMP